MSTPVLAGSVGTAALRLGPYTLGAPVVLAPMAGITNQSFRRLCREQALGALPAEGGAASSSDAPAGIFVNEMVTSRALVERSSESMRLIQHDADEHPRSVQLYSVDPVTAGQAVRMLVSEGRADHIDLNFGCPVPKVTRKGGGSALPWKTELFRSVVAAAVREASPYGVPVTVKMRKGVDSEHLTYLEAGRIAEGEGAAWVALHARTAAEYYSGTADWTAIARLKEVVTSIPVLGNGDVWEADDALRMVAETGADGVVVGRGCLGRPWLFADLVSAFSGSPARVRPSLGPVLATMRRHAELLAEHFGDEGRGCRDMRKHIAWYLKGYAAGSEIRQALALIDSLDDFDVQAARLDPSQEYPGDAAEGPRGRQGSARKVALPDGWLEDRELSAAQAASVAEAEAFNSGG